MKKNISALLVCLFAANALFGAELVQTPDGILLRGVNDWDKETLEVRVDDSDRPLESGKGTQSFHFSHADLCRQPAYRVGGGAWRSLSKFCRMNEQSETSFLFTSDTQEFHEEHYATARFLGKVRQQNPSVQFHLIAGDLVHWGTGKEWRAFRKVATAEYSATLPIVPVVGNHEFYLDPLLSYWRWLYEVPSNRQRYYALDFPLYTLVVLDSNVEWLSGASLAAQDKWLETTLAKRSDRPIFVTFHHPGYSAGNVQYLLPLPPAHVRQHWHPLFKKYGVRAVLNGHDHIYQRLRVDGVWYVIAGPAAGSFGAVWSPPVQSELTLPNERTVSLLTVDRDRRIRLQTWSAKSEKLLDDVAL